MSDHRVNFVGWTLFLMSAVGFCIASIGHFRATVGAASFLALCFVFKIPFFRAPR